MSQPNTLPADPDGMNHKRAEWAEVALLAFMEATGTEPENAVSDLIANILHLSDRKSETFGESVDMIKRGMRCYADEIATPPIAWATEE